MYINTCNRKGEIEQFRVNKPEAFIRKPPPHSPEKHLPKAIKEKYEFDYKNIRPIYNIKTLESPDKTFTKPQNGKAKPMKTCK